jgi:N-acetylglutamate synthase-like GNAT family acetyltransferase
MATAPMAIQVRDAAPRDSGAFEPILRALPDWFGIEESLLQYARDAERWPTLVAEAAGEPVGFLTLHRHFARAAEVHCMAVVPAWHRRGVGRALLKYAESVCRGQGVEYLQVKTLGPSRECEHYARTRLFYEAVGFVPLEEFPNLWPGNPCLLLVKRL